MGEFLGDFAYVTLPVSFQFIEQLYREGLHAREAEVPGAQLPGSSVEKFYFTVHDDTVAGQIMNLMGKRVSLHYEEKVGLPTSCFGDTRYFVTKVAVTPDIPLGPGVVLPGQATAPGPAASAASAP